MFIVLCILAIFKTTLAFTYINLVMHQFMFIYLSGIPVMYYLLHAFIAFTHVKF